MSLAWESVFLLCKDVGTRIAVFDKFYPTLKKLLAMSALCLASLA